MTQWSPITDMLIQIYAVYTYYVETYAGYFAPMYGQNCPYQRGPLITLLPQPSDLTPK